MEIVSIKECTVHRNWSDLTSHYINRDLCISISVCRDCGFVLCSVPYKEGINAKSSIH